MHLCRQLTQCQKHRTSLTSDMLTKVHACRYFIIEMFEEFQSFFKFVLHAQSVVFAVPLAIRFHHRPLFVFFMQAMLLAIFQPYPVVADLALYLVLLPLFFVELRRAQGGMFLGLVMLLAAILGPATHYQWIHTGSANSNFYYAATLAWAGSQVALLLLFMGATIDHDRELAGKPLQFRLARADKDD
jgi:GPI-anchor transamidase subunit U